MPYNYPSLAAKLGLQTETCFGIFNFDLGEGGWLLDLFHQVSRVFFPGLSYKRLE